MNLDALNRYSPVLNEAGMLSAEADLALKQLLSQYKSCFYALRQVVFKTYMGNQALRSAVYMEAKAAGELEQFIVAPGKRLADGSYSPPEWDKQARSRYLYRRFQSAFADAFDLERITANSYRDAVRAFDVMLDWALANYPHLIGEQLEQMEDTSLHGLQRAEFDLPGGGILRCYLGKQQRQLVIEQSPLPKIIVEQTAGEASWKGGVTLGSLDKPLNSKQTARLAELLQLASRLNLGIKEFVAQPDTFLGLESLQIRRRNRAAMKETLLQLNQAFLTEWNARKQEKAPARRTSEILDAAPADDFELYELDREALGAKLEAVAQQLQADPHNPALWEQQRILQTYYAKHFPQDAAQAQRDAARVQAIEAGRQQPTPQPGKLSVQQRKQQQEAELQRFLAEHPEFAELEDDPHVVALDEVSGDDAVALGLDSDEEPFA